MTRDQVITLCEYVAHACPQQRFDTYTPNVWADILAGQGYSFEECRAAVVAIKRRQPWVDPSEIIAEAKRARAKSAESQRREELIGPVRAQRDELKDPRPLREEIRALVSKHFGRPELTP